MEDLFGALLPLFFVLYLVYSVVSAVLKKAAQLADQTDGSEEGERRPPEFETPAVPADQGSKPPREFTAGTGPGADRTSEGVDEFAWAEDHSRRAPEAAPFPVPDGPNRIRGDEAAPERRLHDFGAGFAKTPSPSLWSRRRRITLHQGNLREAIVWSELIRPPRALRPYSPHYREK